MKKIFLIFICLFFFINPSLAATNSVTSSYELPYPGILPDHPLYPLKVIRDKVYDFFLADPLKKAEFKLLMSDKRIYMSIMLKERGKTSLSYQTISKASKYFEESVMYLYKARNEGRNINELKEKLVNASNKYQEIILGFQVNSSEKDFKELQGSLDRILKYKEELVKIENMQQQEATQESVNH